MFPELVEWILGLDRQFAFLLSLPFVVAFAGLLSEAVRQRRLRRDSRHARSATTPHNRPSFSR
jgi:hypothetical protein